MFFNVRRKLAYLELSRPNTVQLVNLGCAKNVVDSEEMLGYLSRDGFALAGASRRADVVVINTCGFLKTARDESMSAIREAVRRKRKGAVRRVVVAGCMAQLWADEIRAVPGVDAVVGPGMPQGVATIARDSLNGGTTCERIDPEPLHRWTERAPRVLSTPPWTAYLKIAEGCDHTCAFCAIPSIRGPYTSKPVDSVLAEAANLAERGVAELNLIAQDTSRYGSDLQGRPTLSLLLREISAVPGIRWIRVLYSYPSHALDATLEAMASLPKVCRYVDIPLQHADDRVLRAMGRPGSGSANLALVRRMRGLMPDAAVRTTFITGFPGETDEEFSALLRFVEEAEMDRVGAFEFSPEPGTSAADLPDQVPAPVRRRRRDALMRLQQTVSLERNRQWIGKDIEVLVEQVQGSDVVGRSFRDAPEVDGTVVVRNTSAAPGTFITARVTEADHYDLYGLAPNSDSPAEGASSGTEARL